MKPLARGVHHARALGPDEAVLLANDTEYGLSASVFSRDIARALDVARRIDSGIATSRTDRAR